MKRINKRGSTWFTEETGKFILSVLVIVVLVMLGYKIYSIFSSEKESQQAKVLLGEIERISESLEKGKSANILVESPKGWRIVNVDDKTCICSPVSFGWWSSDGDITDQKNICKKENICSTNKLLVSSKCENYMSSCLEISFIPYVLSIVNGEFSVISSVSNQGNSEILYSFFRDNQVVIEALLKNPKGENEQEFIKESLNKFVKEKYPAEESKEWVLGVSIDGKTTSIRKNVVPSNQFFNYEGGTAYKFGTLDNKKYSLELSFGDFQSISSIVSYGGALN